MGRTQTIQIRDGKLYGYSNPAPRMGRRWDTEPPHGGSARERVLLFFVFAESAACGQVMRISKLPDRSKCRIRRRARGPATYGGHGIPHHPDRLLSFMPGGGRADAPGCTFVVWAPSRSSWGRFSLSHAWPRRPLRWAASSRDISQPQQFRMSSGTGIALNWLGASRVPNHKIRNSKPSPSTVSWRFDQMSMNKHIAPPFVYGGVGARCGTR